jgi:hypothetical protein
MSYVCRGVGHRATRCRNPRAGSARSPRSASCVAKLSRGPRVAVSVGLQRTPVNIAQFLMDPSMLDVISAIVARQCRQCGRSEQKHRCRYLFRALFMIIRPLRRYKPNAQRCQARRLISACSAFRRRALNSVRIPASGTIHSSLWNDSDICCLRFGSEQSSGRIVITWVTSC